MDRAGREPQPKNRRGVKNAEKNLTNTKIAKTAKDLKSSLATGSNREHGAAKPQPKA